MVDPSTKPALLRMGSPCLACSAPTTFFVCRGCLILHVSVRPRFSWASPPHLRGAFTICWACLSFARFVRPSAIHFLWAEPASFCVHRASLGLRDWSHLIFSALNTYCFACRKLAPFYVRGARLVLCAWNLPRFPWARVCLVLRSLSPPNTHIFW